MANTSIRAAFERMWQHITLALSGKSDVDHTHSDYVDLTSDQTATGVKTFTNGIEIGDEGVQLTYDAEEGAMRFTFLTAPSVEEDIE